VTNEIAKIFCALFYDREVGVVFGRLICTEILKAITQEYSSDLNQLGRNLKDFHGFHKKINNTVRLSAKPVILKLESQVGIRKALLINDHEIIETPTTKIDQLSVLANLNAIIDLSNEIMSTTEDSFQHMSVDTSDSRILMWNVQDKSTMIVVVDSAVDKALYTNSIEEALELIEQGIFFSLFACFLTRSNDDSVRDVCQPAAVLPQMTHDLLNGCWLLLVLVLDARYISFLLDYENIGLSKNEVKKQETEIDRK
jgi:predicted regulator of Ras-like GTPase activity (Roadblock/LC7/MglB family)